MMTPLSHIPVLARELVENVSFQSNDGVYLDGTFGLGGHSRFMAREMAPDGGIVGLEWDKRLEKYHKDLEKFSSIQIFYDSYERFDFVLASQGFQEINGALLDLGLSSVHIDNAEMGFSFQKEGALDMRYSQDQERHAGDILNEMSENQLASIFFRYGEEGLSRKIARQIVRRRKKKNFTTIQDFVEFLKAVFPSQKGYPWKGIRRIFQALRIEVNQELNNLEHFLDKVTFWMFRENDWLAIISYHSLEDKIVKKRFTELTRECICPREEPVCQCDYEPDFEWVKKVIKPTSKEMEDNPRAASARLRIIRRRFDANIKPPIKEWSS